MQVIDETGKNLGVMETYDAFRLAQERRLDLVEVGPNAKPPVCKLTDYGKFRYQLEKKGRAAKAKQKQSEVKGVRITLRSAVHDLEIRARQAEEFLTEGNKVRIEMVLRGRERANRAFAFEKFRAFLALVRVSYRVEQEAKSGGRGLEMLVVKT